MSYVVVGIISTLLFVWPFNAQLLTNDELKRAIQVADPNIFELVKGHVSIGLNVIFYESFPINIKFR
jgi:hypothetical protein